MYGNVSPLELHDMEAEFFGKKGRERRANRREERAQRKQDKIRARNEGKAQRAGLFANILGGAKSALMGDRAGEGGGGNFPTIPMTGERRPAENESGTAEAKGPNTTVIIVVVLAVVVISFVVVKFMKKPKA